MVTFAGIKPGETFTYRFKVRQAGTYWYHSHSGGQEQEGLYAPIVIEPAKGERYTGRARLRRDAERSPSDVARHHPAQAEAGAGLLQRPPAHPARPDARSCRRQDDGGAAGHHLRPPDVGRDAHGPDRPGRRHGLHLPGERPGPTDNWTGLFRPGEKVRLRFINGSAMTIFDARIPGLRLRVVQADGTT